ncbi:MAG TPA: anthranilate synthase component I family protein [Candidatus Cryosericum sp.]|nr:anthranilate synthase component I family protein [Candidatus Cryosericum sp.]
MDKPFDIPADLDTPVSAYLKLGPCRPRFLLESAEGGERLGRYSFIGFGEALEVRLEAGRLLIGPSGGGSDRLPKPDLPAPRDRDALLATLRAALDRAPRPGPAIPGVLFSGGLVGVAGWDLSRLLDGPASPAPERLAGPQACYLAPRSLLVFDHLTRRMALLHDGSEDERAALRREVRRLLSGPLPPARPPGRLEAPRASLDRPPFLAAVGKAKEEIASGEVYQLVLSVRFEGACDLPPFEAYRALRLLNPSPYMYFCDFGDLALVGSSPEALVRLDGREASLRPIAGTRRRGASPDADEALERELLADPKEAAEHVMLVDLARNDLGRVAVTGSVRVEPYRTVERYSHVMHLVSGVRGVLAPGADAFDLFASSFPAGTVSGAPKRRALELIDAIEPCGRGLYAGTVGYFGHGGSMDQAIAIRTIVFTGGGYAYQAGAGIVADSVPEREHDEVRAKAGALEAALRLAEEGL